MDIKFSGFDWDDGNRNKNLQKHGIVCQEALEVFMGRPLVYSDTVHSTEAEPRYVLLGETKKGMRLFVAFTLRQENVRVISARPMSQKERTWYEQTKK